MIRCAPKRAERMKQLRSWHLSALEVISEPMSALARTSERDCRTRTTNENCTANESWTRTKYTYDAWSRLKTVATAGSSAYPAWGLTWSYDRYGNRKQESILSGCVSPMTCPTNSVTLSATTNRITDAGYAYDLAGNMTNDGSNTLTYDGEGRVTNSASGSSSGAYAFDGNSLRVKKAVSGATTVYIFSGTKVIAEYASGAAPSSPSKEYIYAGSQLLATITSSTTSYHIADHLSPRLTTDSNGVITGQQAHFPFGEDWYASSSTTKFKFTSYERDSESGNDYATMRTSINRLGRFSSSDPLAGSLSDPQSLNRFAYATNDPISLVDPSGLGTTFFTGGMFCGETSGAYVCWFLGSLGGPGHIGLLLDTPELRGGGRSGKRYVNQKVLANCIQDLFGVTLTQFTESVQGTNGSFLGQGPDTLSNGGNDAKISVSNDIQTYSGQGLKALRDSRGNPPLPQGTTALAGLTLWDKPYVNYTANNLSQFNQPASMAAETQVHELGNSLHYITGAAFNPATVPGSDKDAGQALENCVRNRGGFDKP
jgi:RHS repeat-associated protein